MIRREFFAWMAAGTAALKSAYSFAAPGAAPVNAGFSVLQGMTDETSAQFSIVVPESVDVQFQVVPSKASVPLPSWLSGNSGHPGSDRRVWRVSADGLQLGESYLLQIKDASGALLDEREFSALDLSPRKVKLGLVSCALDHLHRKDVWRQLEKQKPDLIFFLGDNVYCDRKTLGEKIDEPDPELIWQRYVATREKVAFYFQKRLTPVLAIWDDHDFGGNNAGVNYPFKRETTDIFRAFFPQDLRPSLESGPGIARKFSAFGADFFLLDGRSFRGEPKKDEPMLGQEQEDWIFTTAGRRATLFLNGSVFFGAYGDFESFEGFHQPAFQNFLGRLRSSEALAGFVSGDVHFSELMDVEESVLGYKTFELVSSSIHSFTFPAHHERFHNPRRREADSNHNFLIFEAEFGADEMRGHVTCWGSSFDQFDGAVAVTRT